MRKIAFARFPLKDLWLPVLPFLPLLAVSILLQEMLSAPEKPILERLKFDFKTEFVPKQGLDYLHLGDFLTYFSVASLHVFVCIGVVCFFSYLMIRLPKRERSLSAIFFAGVLILAVALVLYLAKQAEGTVLVQLGFEVTCRVIEGADLATQLVKTGGCLEPGHISKLTLLAWVPAFSGMAAVAFAAAFAYGNASGLPSHDDPDRRTVVAQRTKSLQWSVYALSAVLVSSTITVTLFASLPLNLFNDAKGVPAKAVSAYVSGLGTFWGVLFTLTLVTTFAAPAFRILRQAYAQGAGIDGTEELRVWLRRHVLVSFKRQFANVLILLAPLLAGSLNSVFSFFAGK